MTFQPPMIETPVRLEWFLGFSFCINRVAHIVPESRKLLGNLFAINRHLCGNICTVTLKRLGLVYAEHTNYVSLNTKRI